MANSQVSICIKALDMIGEKSITAITDATPRALALNREYESTLRELLDAAPWGFAKKPVILTPAVTPPPFRWTMSYTLPADFVSVVMFNGTPVWNVVSSEFDITEGSLVTNRTTCNLEYVFYQTDPSKYSPLFCSAFSCLLAARVAAALRTDGGELSEVLEQRYFKTYLPRARMKNGIQSRRRRYDLASESRFIACRRYSTNG